jgi:adenylylsulfate kinase
MRSLRLSAFPRGRGRFLKLDNSHRQSFFKYSFQSERRFGSCSRLLQDTTAGAIPIAPPKKSLLRRILGFTAIAVVSFTAGIAMTTVPVVKVANGYLNPPSDEETLTMFIPQDNHSKEIEDFIQTHAVTAELRGMHQYSESRPHLKVPEGQRSHNLTGGTLMGPGKVVVPPFVWSERGGKSLVSISYLGGNLCGHPGLVHGGLLATLLDEGLARCCFAALPNKVGMTANLNINYRAPAPADAFVVLRAKTTKVEGRKAWVEGHIETLVAPGEKPTLLVEASALFIEPRQAATMARVYPVQ